MCVYKLGFLLWENQAGARFFSQSRSVEMTIQMTDRSVRKLISYFCFRYYFRVQNMIPGVTYKYNIINLLKKESLYNYGKWTF